MCPQSRQQADEQDERVRVADGIGQSLNRLARLSAHVAAQSSKHGYDRATCILLAVLTTKGPSRSSALAEVMHADPSTISRHVSNLVQDGLVTRVVDPDDGRATLLAATDAGAQHLEEIQQRRSEALAGVLGNWDDKDRRQLNTLLQRFVDDYEAHLPDLLSVAAAPKPPAPRGEK